MLSGQPPDQQTDRQPEEQNESDETANCLTDRLNSRMTYWWEDRPTTWPVDWQADGRRIVWPTTWPADCQTYEKTDCLTNSLTIGLTDRWKTNCLTDISSSRLTDRRKTDSLTDCLISRPIDRWIDWLSDRPLEQQTDRQMEKNCLTYHSNSKLRDWWKNE